MDKKLIVILGPTASGKSDLAIKIAKKFNGEIISVDSRQIYKGMDIGTGKVPKDKLKVKNQKDYFYQGIQHHLLNVASPRHRFTVVQYRKLALKTIEKVFKNGKIPILCGGTGFYIQAVVDGILIPEVLPDWKLRKKLEKKSVKELYQIFKKLDPKRAKTIEKENPRRLIRAIEIAKKIGHVPAFKKKPLPYPVLLIGIKKEKKELNSLIKKRFLKWLKEGFLKEVLRLKNPPTGKGLSWQKIESFGIHYRTAAQYLQNKPSTFYKQKVRGKITKEEFTKSSLIELQNYAKRQMTWFKKDKRIVWIKNQKETEKLVKEFLK